MNILTGLIDQIRANRYRTSLEYRSSIGASMMPYQVGKPQWLPRTVESHDRDGYRKVSLIFACIQYLSHAAGTAPLRVYNPEDGEADDTHPLRQLITQPNDSMGEGRFLSFLAMNMAVTNFVVIEKERNRGQGVIALWPLRSDWIRPIPRNQASPDWEYRVPGRDPVILKADDAIVITWADTPDASPTGIGPLETVLREAQISSALTDFLKAFMDRGGVPLYAMIPQDEGPGAAQWKDPKTKDAFMTAWRQRYGGLSNHGDPLPLVGIKDIKRIGLDMNELAYPDLNNMTDARICTAFGVPAILVGAEVGLDRSTFSNAEQAERNFYSGTMPRLWSRIDDAFTRHLLPEFEWRPGWDIQFDTSEIAALQDDRNEATVRGVAAFTSSLVSRHAAQVEAGFDPHGPDEFLIPFNMVPVPNVTVLRGVTARRAVAEVTDPLDPFEIAEYAFTTLPTHDPLAPRFVMREGRRYINETRLSPTDRAERARIVENNQQAIGALADLLAPSVESFFRDQGERVSEALNLRMVGANGSAPIEQRAAEQIDWDTEDDLLRRIFAQWWNGVSETALGNAESLLGTEISWLVTNPYLANLDGVLGQRIVGINAHSRQEIEAVLTGLMNEGTTVPDMGEAIRDLFEQTYQNRHLTVARTESMVGYAEASTMAYEASGVVNRVQVMDNPSHTESYKGAADGLTCAQRNGLVVPLDRGTFHVRSDHPNGSANLAPVLTTPLGEV